MGLRTMSCSSGPSRICGDGVDNDCDGEANADSEATDSVNYYADADGDQRDQGEEKTAMAEVRHRRARMSAPA